MAAAVGYERAQTEGGLPISRYGHPAQRCEHQRTALYQCLRMLLKPGRMSLETARDTTTRITMARVIQRKTQKTKIKLVKASVEQVKLSKCV